MRAKPFELSPRFNHPTTSNPDLPPAAARQAMDSPSFESADLDRLSTKDKQELRQFINNEQQKANLQQRALRADRFPPFPEILRG